MARKPTHNNEGHVKRDIKKLLKKHGWWSFMPQGGKFGTNGIPDFICCKGGKFLAIEAKFGYNKPSDLQTARMNEIRAAGGIAVWVNETKLDTLDKLLETLDAST